MNNVSPLFQACMTQGVVVQCYNTSQNLVFLGLAGLGAFNFRGTILVCFIRERRKMSNFLDVGTTLPVVSKK